MNLLHCQFHHKISEKREQSAVHSQDISETVEQMLSFHS
jgi:hypothetical protein